MAVLLLQRLAFGAIVFLLLAPKALETAAAKASGAEDLERLCYQMRADRLLDASLRKGSVSYREAVRASYGNGLGLPDAVIEAKRRWREEARSRGFTFLCDYDSWNDPAALEAFDTNPEWKRGSKLLADYEARAHRIRLSPEARGQALLHEAGHSLQRASICRGASVGSGYGVPPMRSALRSVDSSLARRWERFRYLSSQDELEVRLQDLNRAYAQLSGEGPILEPLDTLRALAAIGFHVDEQEVVDTFQLVGPSLAYDELASALEAEGLTALDDCLRFPDARELIVLRSLALRLDPERWPELYAKILFEAPGHF